MQKITSLFSYCPRSGSRVINRRPGPEFILAEMSAGTMIAGCIGYLKIESAVPGNHFRSLASRFACEVVEAFGGLAEDDRGCITVATPLYQIHTVSELAKRLLPLTSEARLQIDDQLWSQGCMSITKTGGMIPHHPEYLYQVSPVSGWAMRKSVRPDGSHEYNLYPSVYVVDSRFSKDLFGLQAPYLECGNHRVTEASVLPLTDKGRVFSAQTVDGGLVSAPRETPTRLASGGSGGNVFEAPDISESRPRWAGWGLLYDTEFGVVSQPASVETL